MDELRLPLYASKGPSVARAGALSGAATVNLLVIGALLLPATVPITLQGPRLEAVEAPLVARIVEAAAAVVQPVPPPAPVPPQAPAPSVRPAPAPEPPIVAATAVIPAPAVATPAVADPGATATPPTGTPAPATVSADGVAAADGALAYVEAPQPPYPARALRQRAEGVVLLRVRVGRDGLPLAVEVARGSGHAVLDDAARRQVLRHWRFRPALREGRAVEAVGLVPVAFRLAEG